MCTPNDYSGLDIIIKLAYILLYRIGLKKHPQRAQALHARA